MLGNQGDVTFGGVLFSGGGHILGGGTKILGNKDTIVGGVNYLSVA